MAPLDESSSLAPLPGKKEVKLHGPFSPHSVLDGTPYDDTESEKSLDFIAVQLKILAWLDKNATVDLTAATAREWTELVIPHDRTASPEDALRMCYYMRRLGFNTYGRINDKNEIVLYIAEWNEYDRRSSLDVAYWQQDITTCDVKEIHAGFAQHGHRRRNAISGPAGFSNVSMITTLNGHTDLDGPADRDLPPINLSDALHPDSDAFLDQLAVDFGPDSEALSPYDPASALVANQLAGHDDEFEPLDRPEDQVPIHFADADSFLDHINLSLGLGFASLNAPDDTDELVEAEDESMEDDE